jgi:shikimate dehydrogenase
MKYGLIGEKIGHSFSPQIHGTLASYEYILRPVPRNELDEFIKNRDFCGLNVTIPYKKAVMPFCDYLDPDAAGIGSVNTLVVKDGRLCGYNTDLQGFIYMATRSGISFEGKKIIILGTGGTAMTAQAASKKLGAGEIVLISRTGENNYSNLSRHADADVLVNTTPVGMYPNCGKSPVDLSLFPKLSGVLDVIYNPLKTALLLEAERRGLPRSGGLPMLVVQAKASAELFTGKKIPDTKIEEVVAALRRQMSNVVLIGMPGSGKSTLGKALAQELGKKFVDTDEEIATRAGMSIPEIFARHGEGHFRQLESEVISDLGKETGYVIATGGGCVLRDENYLPLRQNGIVLYITRPIKELPADGRPLSQSGSLEEMFRVRRPRYELFADAVVDNSGDFAQTVQKAIEVYYENIGDKRP